MIQSKHKKQMVSKLVLVRMTGENLGDKQPVFIFSTSQVEEVIHEANEKPVPFGPDYLVGFCVRHSNVLPVIDIAQCFGFRSNTRAFNSRYLVIRDVVPLNNETVMERCVLKVPDQIMTDSVPNSLVPVSSDQFDIDASLIRGLFVNKKELMIMPDMAKILCS